MRFTKEFLKFGITDKTGDTRLLTDLVMKGDSDVTNCATMLEQSSVNKINDGFSASLLNLTWVQNIGTDYYAGGFFDNTGIIYQWSTINNNWTTIYTSSELSAQTCGGYYMEGLVPHILIGTLDNGLWDLKLEGGTTFNQIKSVEATGVYENAIRTIEYNETLDLLYVGDSEGIWRYDETAGWTQLPTISDEVLSIIKEDSGKLLVGTKLTGFYWSLDDTIFTSEETTGIIFDTINDMCQCVDGKLILATNSYLWLGEVQTDESFSWTHIDGSTPYGEVGLENTGVIFNNNTWIVSSRDGIYSSDDGITWSMDDGDYLTRGSTQFESVYNFLSGHFIGILFGSFEYKYAIEFQVINHIIYDYLDNNTNTSWIDRWDSEHDSYRDGSYVATDSVEADGRLVVSMFKTGLAGIYVSNATKTRFKLLLAPDNTYVNMLTCVEYNQYDSNIYVGSLGDFVYKISNWKTDTPTWTKISKGNAPTPTATGDELNIREIIFNTDGSFNGIYIGTDDGLYYHTNVASGFTYKLTPYPAGLSIYKMYQTMEGLTHITLAGTNDGLYRFSYGGGFVKYTDFPTVKVNDILIGSWTGDDYAIFATNNKMYKCIANDKLSLGGTGQPFEHITQGVTDNDILSIAYDSTKDLIYVGSFVDGVYISSNGGNSYSYHDSTYFLDSSNITFVNHVDESLYIGTYGQGRTWRYDEYGEIEKQDFYSDLVISASSIYDTELISNRYFSGVPFNLKDYLYEYTTGGNGIELDTDSVITRTLSSVYENEKNKVFSIYTKITNASVLQGGTEIYNGDITHTKFINIEKFGILDENTEGHYIPNTDFLVYMDNSLETYFRNNLLETNQALIGDVLHFHALAYDDTNIYVIKLRFDDVLGTFLTPDSQTVNTIPIGRTFTDIDIKTLDLNLDSDNDLSYMVLLDNKPYILYTKKDTNDTEYDNSLIELNNDTFVEGINKYYEYELVVNKELSTFKNTVFMKMKDNTEQYLVLRLIKSSSPNNTQNSTTVLGNNIVLEERYISSDLSGIDFLYTSDDNLMDRNLTENTGIEIVSILRDGKYLSYYNVDTDDRTVKYNNIDVQVGDLSQQSINEILFNIFNHLLMNYINFNYFEDGFNSFPVTLTIELNDNDYYAVVNYNQEEYYIRTVNQEYNIKLNKLDYNNLQYFNIKFYDNTDTEVEFRYSDDVPLTTLKLSIDNLKIKEG